MSDAFDFLFSFYGLLLGLSVAEIAAGFSRAYDLRRQRRIGWLAPMFGVVLLLDLITYWLNAWAMRDLKEVTFPLAAYSGLIALLYYFAATQVFPREGADEGADAHILDHRRAVVAAVVASNILAFLPDFISAFSRGMTLDIAAQWLALNSLYYGLLALAALASSRRAITGALVAAMVLVAGATTFFG